MQCAPTSPIKNDDDDDDDNDSASDSSPPSMSPSLLQAKLLKQHQLAKITPSVQQIQKMLSNDATKSNYLVNGLSAQMVDYDPFNDYMGMDKMMLNNGSLTSPASSADPTSLLKSKMAALQLNSSQQFDAQQQQQLIALAAAVASNQSVDLNQSNKPNNLVIQVQQQ